MKFFVFFFCLIALTGTSLAQVATFDGGSIYDLDPRANQSTGNRILEQMLANDDMQPVTEIARSDIIRKLAKPVGRLTLQLGGGWLGRRKKGAYCTASLITRNLIITNYHCVPGNGNVKKVILTMGYLEPRKRTGVAQYPVDRKPVEANEKLDYAILRVEGNPGDEWGTISMSKHTPDARNTLFIVHHPGGFPKYISRGRCQTSNPAIDGNDLLHVCDTLPGSSGAPIFDNSSRKVIGLHFSAVALKKLNAGKRIASIAESSKLIARLVQKVGGGGQPKESAEVIAMRKQLAALKAEQQKWKRRKKPVKKANEPKVAVGIYPKQPRPTRRRAFEPEVVHIPGGTFRMGCVSGLSCDNDEKPVHLVTVGSFYLAKYETNFAQWDACVNDGGCKHKPKDQGWGRGNRPVINVSWNDAVSYAKWLSHKTGQTWRLPTEAEWEYAARGDRGGNNKTKYHFGNSTAQLCDYGNHADKSVDYVWKNKVCSDGVGKKPASVGSYKLNGLGVYDMHGNVWEWVHDWYGNYKKGHQTDPKGPRSGSSRVFRGGSWLHSGKSLRSAYRAMSSPDLRNRYLGFRLLRQPSGEEMEKANTSNSCITIGRKIPRRIEMKVGTDFCDKDRRNKARVVKIYNRGVRFAVNGRAMTCTQGKLCGFEWPSKPLFQVEARADKVKGIKPRAAMLPR